MTTTFRKLRITLMVAIAATSSSLVGCSTSPPIKPTQEEALQPTATSTPTIQEMPHAPVPTQEIGQTTAPDPRAPMRAVGVPSEGKPLNARQYAVVNYRLKAGSGRSADICKGAEIGTDAEREKFHPKAMPAVPVLTMWYGPGTTVPISPYENAISNYTYCITGGVVFE